MGDVGGTEMAEFALIFRSALKSALKDPPWVDHDVRATGSSVDQFLEEESYETLIDTLAVYSDMLVRANRSLNLTRITEPTEVAIKHVIDSLCSLFVGDWPDKGTVLDLGTGAGLPGVVIAAARPDLHVTMVDSSAKKVRFVDDVCEELNLSAKGVHGRAEELGRMPVHREQYDVVVSRAVARMPVLVEYCLPFVKIGGWFVAMKGPDGERELEEADWALQELGGETKSVRRFVLPHDAGQRLVIGIQKVRPTPKKYPRRAGLPAKKPLLSAGSS